MSYGFRPENWPAFQAELQRHSIVFADIEKVEIRPEITPRHDVPGAGDIRQDAAREAPMGFIHVTVTLRSGRVESWRQRQTERD